MTARKQILASRGLCLTKETTKNDPASALPWINELNETVVILITTDCRGMWQDRNNLQASLGGTAPHPRSAHVVRSGFSPSTGSLTITPLHKPLDLRWVCVWGMLGVFSRSNRTPTRTWTSASPRAFQIVSHVRVTLSISFSRAGSTCRLATHKLTWVIFPPVDYEIIF